MGFMPAVKKCLRDWITFSGRAPRSEYWWFVLFQMLVFIVIGIVAGGVMGAMFASLSGVETGGGGVGIIGGLLGIVLLVVYIYFYIASISAAVRRLHDRNMTGWWIGGLVIASIVINVLPFVLGGDGGIIFMILALVLLVLSIYVFVMLILKGTDGPNKYGPDPLAGPVSSEVFE